MNRRKMISGLVAFAALSVVPGASARERRDGITEFMAAAKTGRVSGRTFYIDGNLLLADVRDLSISECKFVFLTKGSYFLIDPNTCRNVTLQSVVTEAPKGSGEE